MAKHRIRLTFQPTVVVEVEGPEYLDLLKQGVVVPSRAPVPASTPEASAADPAAEDESSTPDAPRRTGKRN